MTTITLCGSSRFAPRFVEANRELTLRGLLVFPLGTTTGCEADNRQWSSAEKEMLDLVHLAKILQSDAILVLGDGYIGWSTSREILWAALQDKPVVSERQAWPDATARPKSRAPFLLDHWDVMANLLRRGKGWPSILVEARGVLEGQPE